MVGFVLDFGENGAEVWLISRGVRDALSKALLSCGFGFELFNRECSPKWKSHNDWRSLAHWGQAASNRCSSE
jgi:hypothetical protein